MIDMAQIALVEGRGAVAPLSIGLAGTHAVRGIDPARDMGQMLKPDFSENRTGGRGAPDRSSLPAPDPATSRLGGFSLIELLVVMAIIAILSSLGMVAFSNIGRGSGVRGAADLAASLALSARVEAMSYGHGSLLVVDNGTNAGQKWRRFAVFRYTNTPVEGSPMSNAVLIGKPVVLQQGVFFRPDDSTITTNTATMNLPPRDQPTEVYYVKFAGDGQLAGSSGVKLIFGGGIAEASGTPTFPASMNAGRQGFLLRKNGRPAFYQTPEQIDTP